MNKARFSFLSFGFIFIMVNSHAGVFCVNNSPALQNALSLSEGNGQSDTIKIISGTYMTPSAGFKYLGANENFDLEISGGWDFLTCSVQTMSSAFETVLDADNQNRIMELQSGLSSDVKISNLTFLNGDVGLQNDVGGLYIPSLQNGSLVLENNAFINNVAKYFAALYVGDGEKIVIRNNLFTDNFAKEGISVYVVQSNALGVYFTNNTVAYNATNSSLPAMTAGSAISVSGSSQAYVANNVLWGNQLNDLRFYGTGFKYFYHNDFGSISGETPDVQSGNFSLEPLFEPGSLNFMPQLDSPLVDKGIKPPRLVPIPTPFDQNWALGVSDLEGNDRTQGAKVDVGAIESSPEVPLFKNGFE